MMWATAFHACTAVTNSCIHIIVNSIDLGNMWVVVVFKKSENNTTFIINTIIETA